MLLHAVLTASLNMVFNEVTMNTHRDLHPDSKIIDALGGATKLAELLGYDKTHGGIQRIQNWKTRGIPSSVKIAHPELFLTDLIERAKATDDTQGEAGGSISKNTKESRAIAF